MATTLDGQIVFDEQQLEIKPASIRRDSIERTVAGLDSVISVDLGERGRQIRQTGQLRAKSRVEMNARISVISAYMDGNTHKLVTSDGEELDNVRMDAFEIGRERTGGSGVCCDYKIVYTQL